MKKKVQGPVRFFLMSMRFLVRDFFRPPIAMLRPTGIMPAQSVLDYGCGPGAFSVAAARLVGPEGKVYAMDINPVALATVRRAAGRRRLKNLITLAPDDFGNVPSNTVDTIILHDVLHCLAPPVDTLSPLHRTARRGGLLLVNDHHMSDPEIVSAITSDRLFIGPYPCPVQNYFLCFRRADGE